MILCLHDVTWLCQSFSVEKSVAVVVVLVLNSYKVQKNLVGIYQLVGHIYSCYFFVFCYCIVVDCG